MGLENPLLYMDVEPVVWMAGAWAVLNMMEALHRERPDLSAQQLIEITRRDVRFIVGPLRPAGEGGSSPPGVSNEDCASGPRAATS